jgi:hypothetical protein
MHPYPAVLKKDLYREVNILYKLIGFYDDYSYIVSFSNLLDPPFPHSCNVLAFYSALGTALSWSNVILSNCRCIFDGNHVSIIAKASYCTCRS